MRTILITLALAGWVPALAAAEKKDQRPPSPFAPSLPQLTDAEEEAIDRIIDRFIRFDTGRLPGPEGKKALADLQKLGPEAIFGLIRGLNRAAKLDASCPALTIGRKVASILRTTRDVQLLEFARENIGAGVTSSPHQGLLRELRVGCMFRKRAVLAMNLSPSRVKPGATPLSSRSVAELAGALKRESGPRLRAVMAELGNRRGEKAVSALASAAASDNAELRPLGRTFLVHNLSRLGSEAVGEMLRDRRPEVRLAAARAAARKGYRLGDDLINLLTDDNAEVSRAAHQALLKLSRGTDYGPRAGATEAERSRAVAKWREWWSGQER